MHTHPELKQPLLNLERLAGEVSRITGEKIQIVKEISANSESYHFVLPEKFLLHIQLVPLMEMILKTVKDTKNGLFFMQTYGRLQIHTFVVYNQ